MSLSKQQRQLIGRLILLLGGLTAVFWLSSGPKKVGAQSVDRGVWGAPVNLSESGTAVRFSSALDDAGNIHLLWQDPFAGFGYTSGNGEVWDAPRAVRVPFTNPPFSPVVGAADFGGFYQPELVVAPGEILHAFWIDEDGVLRASRAPLANVASPESWSPTAALAGSTTNLSASVGDDGRLHLIYLNKAASENGEAAILAIRSEDGGVTWSEPLRLYTSNYLRSINPERMNLQVVAAANGMVYAVWDDPGRESVYFTRSSDGGVSWSETPTLIDKRWAEDALESPGAQAIDLLLREDEIHLFWYAGHRPRACIVYHQVSADAGISWQPPVEVLDMGSTFCPDLTLSFVDENGLVFLLTKVSLQSDETLLEIFLQAWDGEAWSEPVRQEDLSDVRDTITYRKVTAQQLAAYVMPGNQLMLLTDGKTRDTDDIWSLARLLGDSSAWSSRFAPPTMWRGPQRVSLFQDPLHSPTIFVDQAAINHLFWLAPAGNDGRVGLYHASEEREGEAWTRPLAVLNSSPGDIEQLDMALDQQRNRFVVTWVDSQTRALQFSQVNVDSVNLVSDWAQPLVLPVGAVAGGEWPQLLMDQAQDIMVVFAAPVNEGRGVYLARSTDGGNTWQEPTLVFDGVAGGWLRVGRPLTAVDDEGVLHMLIERPLSLADDSPVELYYTRSDDKGATWLPVAQVNERRVVWADILSDAAGTLHIIFQEKIDGRLSIGHTYSSDGGATWSTPIPVADFEEEVAPTAATIDPAGALHLLFLADGLLQYRSWDGVHWLVGESRDLLEDEAVFLAVTAMVGNGRLHAAYIVEPLAEAEEADQEDRVAGNFVQPETGYSIHFLSHPVEASPIVAAPPVEPTPLAAVAAGADGAGPTETAATGTVQEALPVPSLSDTAVVAAPSGRFNPMLIYVVGIGGASLLILVVFLARLMNVRRKRHEFTS